ncbi:MAG: hypothetical protein JSW15_08375 [Deltaproteobacteria bacterium]|nr:MAG: hypothetical protein JSW15_08375 [Deltaproteobacteria bacterium]
MRKLLFLSLLPTLLCSCIDEVYWTNPISDIRNACVDERLFGTWKLKNMRIYFHIGRGDKTSIRYVCQELNGGSKSLPGIMHVSKLGERMFLNMKLFNPDVKGIPEAYLVAEYEIKSNDNLIMFFPRHNYIKEAIEDKMLSGEIGNGSSGPIVVRSDSPIIRTFIRNSPHWIFSDIKEFKRLDF